MDTADLITPCLCSRPKNENGNENENEHENKNENKNTGWKLPRELILYVIELIIDTPAVFIFDVQIGLSPHPPLLPQGCQVHFIPITSSSDLGPTKWINAELGSQTRPKFPAVFESQVSKTIRSLLLTSKFTRDECLRRLHGIPVPTVYRDCIVRFNPNHHITCVNMQAFSFKLAGSRQAAQIWSKECGLT
ncbi:hypothetical protein VP1G_10802 [Cytospora mali]|uniref:Uncharacterized protein n=1 Tax=Cytospora mali TaxID=578113 RepID=A0A194UX69_CYTMA|nr:hypothetical protein VP1G_10802 [Valsa mali var. pyri (nom. inval.)]